MTDRPEPLDEALAVFSVSHPGREPEALRAALAIYEKKNGHRCTNPGAYFGAWPVDQLVKHIRLAALPGSCPDCHGEGWIYTDVDDDVTARKCTHPRKAVA
jgi:hypothetical protein